MFGKKFTIQILCKALYETLLQEIGDSARKIAFRYLGHYSTHQM